MRFNPGDVVLIPVKVKKLPAIDSGVHGAYKLVDVNGVVLWQTEEQLSGAYQSLDDIKMTNIVRRIMNLGILDYGG